MKLTYSRNDIPGWAVPPAALQLLPLHRHVIESFYCSRCREKKHLRNGNYGRHRFLVASAPLSTREEEEALLWPLVVLLSSHVVL